MSSRQTVSMLLGLTVAFSGVLARNAPPSSARRLTAGGEWTSFTFDNFNSRNQTSSTITSDNVASLKRVWSYRTGEDVTGTPVVLGGRVYFADWGGNVYAVDLASGSLVWQQNVGSAVSSTLLLADGRVYVGIGPNFTTEVVALSQTTGAVVWDTHLHGTVDGVWASPTEMNGVIYIGIAAANGQSEGDPTTGGAVFALDAGTGTVIWKVFTSGTAGGAAVWGSVVVDPVLNAIYFGTGNPYGFTGTTKYAYSIVSLDATTGQLNWSYQIYSSLGSGGDADFGSTPNLFAYIDGGGSHDAVGLGNKNGQYYVLDRTNGALLQQYAVSDAGPNLGVIGAGGFNGTFGVANNIFIPGRRLDGGVVSAVQPSTNQISWQTELPGDIVGSVALVPGAVLVGDALGHVYALATTDGAVLKRLTLPSPVVNGTEVPTGVYGGVTVAEGWVVVPGAFGANRTSGIYAFAPVP